MSCLISPRVTRFPCSLLEKKSGLYLSSATKQEKMAIISGAEEKYLERMTSIQQSIHQREKQRLQLENELFTCTRPNKRTISQIKGSKLHGYLKQICVREAQAKMRNLELLRDVECLQISIQQYRPNLFALQQQKRKSVQSNCEDNSSHKADDFTDAHAVISLGRQTSRGSHNATGITSALSDQALHSSPNRSLSTCKQLPSGPLTDITVVREDASANRAHLSDDISDSNNSPDGPNSTDKHGKRLAMLQFSEAAEQFFEHGDEQEPEPQMTFNSPKRNLSQGSSNDPIGLQNPSAAHVNGKEIAPQTPSMENPGRGFSCLMPQTSFARKSEDRSGRSGSFNSSFDEQLSESSESHLSISITQSDSGDDELEDEATARNNGSEGIWHSAFSTAKETPQLLSIKGFFKLLDSIEDRLRGEQTRVYGNVSIDERQLFRIISLCDSEAGLNEEDLEACSAVVLHELQRLSLSTEKGCLLSHELVSAHQSNTEHMAASFPSDAARLWDRWFKHALLLKESHVLSTERLVELFAPLLVERHATYHHQAKVLLRTLLSRSSEECPSADEESDSTCSCGPPFRPAHGGDAKPARRIQKQQIQELQSTEEESHDESPVKSVPIRETKAYQLLKLSAMQERLQSSEEEGDGDENDPPGTNHGPEVDLGRAKRSSHQDPYPRKDIMNPKIYSALQSKELWGDSDDSNSDIEAALRPQPFNTNDDDTDDFYD
ncbi:centrosomal protein kizuna isoform X2 [Corythoichthys intestinalis]|uniref:centrosomal protein kizuna isoform X2 n=1 Tax=Corythoichthys intestinalis TaxID=161448 RepID=UPI0025A5D49A|nr:centrosomal protein kizuna isoform X2 [Corythoichthys intestinalis]